MSDKTRKIVSWVLTGLVGLGLVASALGKLTGGKQVTEGFEHFRLTPYIVTIGVIELICAVLFLVPKTSSIGTLLVTGYFGGAIVTHLSAGEPIQIAPAIVLGLLAWVANYLKNPNMFESLKK